MAPKKRKRDLSQTGDASASQTPKICVIHFLDSSGQGFTQLTEDRLTKLLQIRQARLSLPVNSKQRLETQCTQIPDAVEDGYGYHRDCHRRFTAHIKTTSTASELTCTSPRQLRVGAAESERCIFNPDCIFCNKDGIKKVKQGAIWTTETTCKFEFGGGQTILHVAEQKKDFDLLRRIKGYDLFACEARYHRSCRRNYIRDPSSWQSSDAVATSHQAEMEAAHQNAFFAVCAVIDDNIIQQNAVMKLDDLRNTYIDSLRDTGHYNENYRSEKLKTKLVKRYDKNLSFQPLRSEAGLFESYLVFNSMTDVGKAVEQAYLLGRADKTRDVALALRSDIQTAHKDSEPLPWPPSARDLEHSSVRLPADLEKFLQILITGKEAGKISSKNSRLIDSVGQDLSRAATNGSWKMPKHILLCMTLRHLFRSAELTTILNRFGHCENYSFSLELETALASALQETSNILSVQIVRNPPLPSVFHSDFDNFDQNTESGSIHTSHGIMLQEVGPLTNSATSLPSENDQQNITTNTIQHITYAGMRSGERSLKVESTNILPECYIAHKESPSYNVTRRTCTEGAATVKHAQLQNLLWVIVRMHSAKNNQQVPGWAGFVSATGETPAHTTTIGYYPVINCPITEYKAVQECLRYSEEATKEVGQRYTISTFDLGVCMKAYPLIWKNPERYKDHIIMIGSFHVVCAYMKMVGKKMDGSGLSDVLLEAGLVTSGSVPGILAGKQYNRALTCHKTLLEALERLLLQGYLSDQQDEMVLSGSSRAVFDNLLASPTSETLVAAMDDENIRMKVETYAAFRSEVAGGKLGKTAQLWLSYMDHIWLVLELLQAVKTNNLLLYSHCLFNMADLFFSFDGHNYSRYLTFFSVFLANVEETHPGASELLKAGAISIARSFVPGNRCAVDKTIEETFMKHAKSHGGSGGCGAGLTGILNNFNAYQRWVKTTHERAQYVDVTYAKVDMPSESQDGSQHKDLRRAEVQKSERRVQNTMNAVLSFLNPFTVADHDKLYCISSGVPASASIEKDIMAAESLGKQAKESFIAERLETKEHFFDPVKKLKLKTFQSSAKTVKLRTAQNQIITYKQHSSVAIQLLVKSQAQGRINLDELMKYPLSSVPYSLGTTDGYMAKNDKSKGMHFLVKDIDDAPIPHAADTLMIQDGNALFHTMTHVPGNFQLISHQIFDSMPKTMDFIFSTDMYQEGSIKDMERKQRGSSEKLIIGGPLTKKPADWKNFLMNGENKSQLVRVMGEVWSSNAFAPKLGNRKVTLVVLGHCYSLHSDDGKTVSKNEIQEMFSDQEETDTRVVLYCEYAQAQGYDTVRVRSPDSDIFFILLHHASSFQITILFDTGAGNRRRLLNISALARKHGQRMCTALMSLHALTHCDTTSAYKGLGKVRPIKHLQKTEAFVDALAKLGDIWDVPVTLFTEIEHFTCAMYGRPRFKSVDAARAAMLKEKSGGADGNINLNRSIDLSLLPPCQKALLQHIKRANFQVGIWKAANIPQPALPQPVDGHGWKMAGGKLQPMWFEGPLIPPELAVEDESLQSDGDVSSSESDIEEEGGANMASSSESDDD